MGEAEPTRQGTIDLIPVRMLNEWAYCPRLFWLMHVEGQMVASADVWEGRFAHARRDRPSDRKARRAPKKGGKGPGRADEEGEAAPWREVTALTLSSEELGVVGKLDAVLLSSAGQAIPVEAKKGKAPAEDQGEWCISGVWRSDAVQVGAQALLLRAHGYDVPRGEVYFMASKKLVEVRLGPELEASVREAIREARAVMAGNRAPPPLPDSPKCRGCSLHAVCLPAESHHLASGGAAYLDDPDGSEPAVRRVMPARIDESVLVVETPGAVVRRRAGGLAVEVPRAIAEETGRPRETRVAFEALHEVCLIGAVQVTAQAMDELLRRRIPVSYVSRGGGLRGMVLGPWGNNVRLRVAQHRLAGDERARLPVARAIVEAKVRNQRTLIRRNDRPRDERALSDLQVGIRQSAEAKGIAELMGIEGRAARTYFERFAALVEDRSGGRLLMVGRSRRPPKDPVNALLSFGYAVLCKDLVAICHRVGFDPMVGILHGMGYGRPALALDLMEEFRPLVVDSTVLRMVAQGQVSPGDFDVRPGEVRMRSPLRRRYLGMLEDRKQQLVSHPVFGYRLSYRRTFEVQVRALALLCLGEAPSYLPFVTR